MSEVVSIGEPNRGLEMDNLVNMEEYWRFRKNVAQVALKYAVEQHERALTRLEDFRDQDPLF